MKKKSTIALFLMALLPSALCAQRIQQTLGRSVVAVTDPSGSAVNVTWRKLAQEPENCTYNLYVKKSGASDFTKLNSDPISNTNYQTTRSIIPYDSELAVTYTYNGVESEKSNTFLFEEHSYKDAFFEFDFDTTVLNPNKYKAKYAWPMDLDGNGEFDAVLVDRLHSDDNLTDPSCETTSHKLQAYKLDGTLLWTVDMGPNVAISAGQNDMVLAYDINCDGKCEVIIRSSDGTRFWDAANNTWGNYVNGSTTGDTDGDGIEDYRSSTTMNPPYYITIIDGKTGAEITSSELNYSAINDGEDQYSRTNRADYMNDNDGTEYAFLSGKFAICYFDGIHPSLAIQCYDRSKTTGHHYYVLEWKYDWTNGTPSNWHHDYTWCFNGKTPTPAEYHQFRVCDVDGDGIDEVMEGGYAVNSTKGMVMSPGIGHGDRFDVSDIDPDRPGLEVFAIQQTNLMGQVLYDAATGEHIKEWYLSTIGDVGRGRCIDVDAGHKGYEVFSTMPNLYDCKGNVITEGETTYPVEAVWWDGNLQRELISSPGGNNYATNAMVMTYGGSRLIQFSRESSWAVHAGPAVRPAYMGDMTGDWREELILMKQDASSSTGLVGYSTDIATDYSMYTLQEDPHYRLDCTTRGYYQMPCTGFYLGGDMPYPPLPPTMVTDLRWSSGSTWSTSGSGFTSFDQSQSQSYADGKSVLFDMSGDNSQTIAINGTISPSVVYIMAPVGHDYTFGGTGSLAGEMELWKSMQGTATIDANLSYTGSTVISEGTLVLNGTVEGPVDLRAKGTLSGTPTLNGGITFEGGLNYEGCRLMPGNATDSCGVMTFGKSITIPGAVYIESTLNSTTASKIVVNGDLTFEGSNTFTINASEVAQKDYAYVLAECTGTLTVNLDSISVRGLDGINYTLTKENNQIVLTMLSTRAAQTNVAWVGSESSAWDYKTENFAIDGTATTFVTNDEVVFDDTATNRTVTVSDALMTNGVTFDFDNGTYTFSGSGSIGGTGGITKNGAGEVIMGLAANTYTGATIINEGTLTISSLADGGNSSAIGASANTEGNLELNGGTLNVDATNIATDHIVTLTDTSTINIPKSNATISLKGRVTGTGYLIKDGPGQLNFTYEGANTFAGLILKNGTIAQGAWNATFGSAGSALTLAGGTVKMLDVNNSSTRPVMNYAITVQEGTSNTITTSTRGAVNGSFSGSGSVTIVSDGVRSDIGADFSAFEGELVAQGENFRLVDVKDMKKTNLVIDEGAKVSHYKSNSGTTAALTTTVGSLASTATDARLGNGSDSYEVGYNGESTTYRGILQAATITKYGEGTLTLTNSNSTSAVVVEEGTVQLFNGLSSTPTAFSTGTLTVNDGGTVTGTGGAKVIRANSGGVVAAGYNGGYGTLKSTGPVYMNAGSTLQVKVGTSSTGSATNDKFKFNGSLYHTNDTIMIEVVSDDRVLAAGDEIEIFTGSGTQSGTYILKTVCNNQVIEWDDSELLSSGILKVASASTGISSVVSDDTEVDVYTVDGIKVRDNVKFSEALDGLSNGVYLVNGRKMIKK